MHRDFVRCEYHDALDRPFASHANMIYDGRYKLVVYHGHEIGELYDLEQDPDEFDNLWGRARRRLAQAELTKQLFDAVMLATDPGSRASDATRTRRIRSYGKRIGYLYQLWALDLGRAERLPAAADRGPRRPLYRLDPAQRRL